MARIRVPDYRVPLQDTASSETMTEPNDLSAFWMPFTDNRGFKANPRMLVAAKDMHYTSASGHRVLDATGGLWCVNAGHSRPRDRKSTRLNSSHSCASRMPYSACKKKNTE